MYKVTFLPHCLPYSCLLLFCKYTGCFNPRSCIRSDEEKYTSTRHIQNFNPRSCIRSDISIFNIILRILYFNPRSCIRSDQGTDTLKVFLSDPRSCIRSDDDADEIMFDTIRFQSTLLHKERHYFLYPIEIDL